jgi:hypothetical protein
MAVTKQAYTVTPTWTPAQLATLFENAFIDAGLMTAWHDSFANSGIENRVLAIQYSVATYGTTYYWFQFSTVGVYLQMASGWNTGSDIPSGTQWLDYVSTTTSNVNQHWQIIVASTATTFDLIRYTSSVAPDDSWFCMKTGASRKTFTIAKAARTVQPWMDMSKGIFQGFSHILTATQTSIGLLSFATGPGIRRELVRGSGLRDSTTLADYGSNMINQRNIGYGAVGNISANSGNYNLGAPFIFLPVGFTNANPAYASNYNPVFHSMMYNPYIVQPLSSEFGITFHYATNTFSPQDTFVVSAGVEEWEVLEFTGAASTVTQASTLFLARTV